MIIIDSIPTNEKIAFAESNLFWQKLLAEDLNLEPSG